MNVLHTDPVLRYWWKAAEGLKWIPQSSCVLKIAQVTRNNTLVPEPAVKQQKIEILFIWFTGVASPLESCWCSKMVSLDPLRLKDCIGNENNFFRPLR